MTGAAGMDRGVTNDGTQIRIALDAGRISPGKHPTSKE
jgi:hypothetical protein